MMTLHDALISLEAEMKVAPPPEASSLPLHLKFEPVLAEINKRLSPHAVQISQTIESRHDEAAIIIKDALGSYVTNDITVATTIARYLVMIGVDAFCKNPSMIFVHC
jgi:hypothetical protein